MKKVVKSIILAMLLGLVFAFMCFAACDENIQDVDNPFEQAQTKKSENNGNKTGDQGDMQSTVLTGTDIETENLTLDGTNLSVTVSNATTSFSFINKITMVNDADWKMYSDISCTVEIVSKTISLDIGDNIVYILVTNGGDMKLYTATVRRRPRYLITFNTNGGVKVESQTIEEDCLVATPQIKKIDGYSLTGKWNYDFSTPIKKDMVITGAYTADVKLSDDGKTITGLNNNVSTLVILSEYNGIMVTSIKQSAFDGCRSLTSITIPDSITNIGYNVFCNCSSLTTINVENANTEYKSIDGNLYNKDGTTLIQYAIGKKNTSFIIPDSVEWIESGAFECCSTLRHITISSRVITIEGFAFYKCSELRSIMIPNSVTSIGGGAFEYCSSLTSVTFENPNGWCLSNSSSGKDLILTDDSQNAIYLKSTFARYFWMRR